jgi:hypothetical protein
MSNETFRLDVLPFRPNFVQPVTTGANGIDGELFLATDDAIRGGVDFTGKIAVIDTGGSIFKDFGLDPVRYAALARKAVFLEEERLLQAKIAYERNPSDLATLRATLEKYASFHADRLHSFERDLQLQRMFAQYNDFFVLGMRCAPCPEAGAVEKIGVAGGRSVSTGEALEQFHTIAGESAHALGLDPRILPRDTSLGRLFMAAVRQRDRRPRLPRGRHRLLP